MRRIHRAGAAALLTLVAAAFLVPTAGAASGKGKARASRSVSGAAFDTCEAQSVGTMRAWRASPYRAVGIYVGGNNRGCTNRGLTRDWVRQVRGQGWEFLPIYVGSQAPCTQSKKHIRIDPARSWDMGKAEADDAVDRAASVGFAKGSAIYLDMEAYDTSRPECSRAVLDFMSAWSAQVRARGYVAGYYSSLDSGIADLLKAAAAGRALPDAVWYARWDGRAETKGDGALPDDLWRGRRAHQYQGNVTETYGGAAVNIDRNQLDGPVGVF